MQIRFYCYMINKMPFYGGGGTITCNGDCLRKWRMHFGAADSEIQMDQINQAHILRLVFGQEMR